MKHEFIQEHRSKWRVSRMCRALGTSEAGYYAKLNRKPSQRALEEAAILIVMRKIHEEHHRTYGGARMQAALGAENLACGQSRVRRLMRENGLYTVHRKKHGPYPKEKAETQPQENLLAREFKPEMPNQSWVGDITYIRAQMGWTYLATVIDLFNKEVVGYALSRKPSADLVVQALQQAVRRREPPEGLIFHSDRGVQYRSRKHRACLDQNGIQGSMSQKGCPYDNACAESFFATLKKEWIYRHSYASLEEVDSSLFEYIELFYNRKRMHTSLGNLSPRTFLEKHLAARSA
jgi:putative transposase